MKLLNSKILESIVSRDKRLSESLLPELIKRLILSSIKNIDSIRIPCKDDVWAPGFDGIIECSESTKYVCSGKSVWEFGTNKDSLKKINEDYEKRNQDALGIDKTSTAFYLVIPKIWKMSVGMEAWENQHKGEWKKIHIIDASELCDWINSIPSVCCWVFENYYDEKLLSFTSVNQAWEKFKKRTEPNLTQDLFLVGRQGETKLLNENKSKAITRVQGNSFVEALGFTIASVLSHKENREIFIVVEDEITFKKLNRVVEDQTFIFTFPYGGDVNLDNNNSVILCFSDADISIVPDIKLNKLSKNNFEDALKKMGLDNIEACRFTKFTDRNVAALLRKIPGTINIAKPDWVEKIDFSYLEPMLLMRSINRESQIDRSLVKFLGVEYNEFENKMNALARFEDSPIKIVDRYFALIHYEEVWNILRLSTSHRCYQTLIELIKKILRNQIPQDNKFFFNTQDTLLENLFKNLIYFASNSPTEKSRVAEDVKDILEELQEEGNRGRLLEYLRILANAVPNLIISFIIKNLEIGGEIDSLFSNQSYTHDYCKILFALESLLNFDESKGQACEALKILYLRNYRYSISNTPKETLSNALCLWNTKNALYLKDKEKILIKFLEDEPVQMGIFTLDLLGKNHYSRSVGVEEFKSDIHKDNVVTYGELIDVIYTLDSKIADAIIATKSTELLIKFIKSSRVVKIEIYESLISRIICDEYDPQEMQKAYFVVLEQIVWCKRIYHHEKNEINKKYIDIFIKYSKKLQSPDLFLRYSSYFQNWDDCPLFDEDDYDEAEFNYSWKCDRKIQYRKKIYAELKKEYGEDLYVRLLSLMSDESIWGQFWLQVDDIDIKNLCDRCIELAKYQILICVLDKLSLDLFSEIFNTFTPDVKIKILSKIKRVDIFDLLDTTENEEAYWTNKIMYQYDEIFYKKLLEYNPAGLLSYYADNENEIDNIEKIVNILKRIKELNVDIRDSGNRCYLDTILKNLDKSVYSEDIAILEWDFYKRKLISGWLEGMRKYYFFNPQKIVEQLNNEDKKYEVYLDFLYNFSLPQIAYTAFTKCELFFDIIINCTEDKDCAFAIVGQILGRSIKGEDGIFPHEFARKIIEKYKNQDLNQSFIVGKRHSEGGRVVEDGSDQIEIADRLKSDANSISLQYPVTAQLLQELSDEHIKDANRDKIFTEIECD